MSDEPQVVERTPSKFKADGPYVRVHPGRTKYDDGTESFGMNWILLEVNEHMDDREAAARLITNALNGNEDALAAIQ